MFQWISIISFAVVIGALMLHHLLFPCGYQPRFAPTTLIRKKVHLFTLLFPEQKRSLASKIRKLAFMLGLLSFVVLLVTGFVPVMAGGKLGGYWLMVHATFAPVFIACAAVVALLGAGQYRFTRADIKTVIAGVIHREHIRRCCPLTDTGLGAKVGFWVLLALSLPVTITMAVSMLPWFGTDGQGFLFEAHRWTALVFALAALVEMYMLIRMEIRKEF